MRIVKLIVFCLCAAIVYYFFTIFNETIKSSTQSLHREETITSANIRFTVNRVDLPISKSSPNRKSYRYMTNYTECQVAWDLHGHIDLGFNNYILEHSQTSSDCQNLEAHELAAIHTKIMSKILKDWNYKRIFEVQFDERLFKDLESKENFILSQLLEDRYSLVERKKVDSKVIFTVVAQ